MWTFSVLTDMMWRGGKEFKDAKKPSIELLWSEQLVQFKT